MTSGHPLWRSLLGTVVLLFPLEEVIVREHLHFILGSAGVTQPGKLILSCGLLMCQNLSREHRRGENINIQNIQTYDLSA